MLPSWVRFWCYQQMLDQTGKFLPGANNLAYLASSLATKKKSFITLTPGHIFYKNFFSSSLTVRQNKLQWLLQEDSLAYLKISLSQLEWSNYRAPLYGPDSWTN
jgi:hypothetical protein